MKPVPQSKAVARSQERETELCAQVSSEKPTFTRPRAGASRSYVASKSKTDHGMLHQSHALKASAADKARDRSETGGGSVSAKKHKLTGNMVEVSGSGASHSPSPASCDAENAGRKAGTACSRVFVLSKTGGPLMPCHPARSLLLPNRRHRSCLCPVRQEGWFIPRPRRCPLIRLLQHSDCNWHCPRHRSPPLPHPPTR